MISPLFLLSPPTRHLFFPVLTLHTFLPYAPTPSSPTPLSLVSPSVSSSSSFIFLRVSSTPLSLLPVRDSADQPSPHFDPFHHVCVIRGHAPSGEPPQRHCLQLRPRADQRHGTYTHTHTYAQSHMLFLHLQHQRV